MIVNEDVPPLLKVAVVDPTSVCNITVGVREQQVLHLVDRVHQGNASRQRWTEASAPLAMVDPPQALKQMDIARDRTLSANTLTRRLLVP